MRNILERIRFCSLSRNCNDKLPEKKLSPKQRLMWPHYTSSYKGFSIEYKLDFSQDLPSKYQDFTDDTIIYMEELIDNFNILVSGIDQTNFQDVLKGLVLLKDSPFQYEEEACILKLASNKEDFIYLDMPLPQKVIFGIHCEETMIESIRAIFSQLFKEPIAFYKIDKDIKEVKL